MLRSRNSKCNEILVTAIMILVFVGGLLTVGGHQNWLPYHMVIHEVGVVVLAVAGLVILLSVFISLLRHGIVHGFQYYRRHYRLMRKLRSELLDAGIYVKRYVGQEEVAVLPRVKVKFDDNLQTGKVQIQRRLKDRKLEDYDISAGLDCYIVEQSYISHDGNSYLYDIFDATFNRQLVFDSCEEYIKAAKKVDDYSLMVDAVTTIPLHHTLLCGQTGSGKSYFLHTLICQMMAKEVAYNLFFCDPKRLELAAIGNKLAPERTAVTVDGIIALLRSYHTALRKRMDDMKELLSNASRVDVSYKDFGLSPNVLIFEEYLSFSLALATCEKKVRDEVSSILADITLLGRACGFFIILVMQSAPSTQIPTFIRDQMVWKVVLGNSDRSTYTVTFDSSADVPVREFDVGYGVFTYAGITEKPKILASPTIRNFDILDAISEGVFKPSPSCNDGEGTP